MVRLERESGARTYPVEYTYDYAGRTNTMTTWQDYAGSAGAAVTTWIYDPYTGRLQQKLDASDKGPYYSYFTSGLLYQRSWADYRSTTYSYNEAGELATVDYSDSETPDLNYTYDRLGRPKQVTHTLNGESWSANFVYGTRGELVSQTWSGGLFDGLAVSNRFDHLLRRTNVAVLDGAARLSASGYAYDPASRLLKVTSGVNNASYSYLANAPLVSQIAFTNNGSWRMTTSKQHDYLNRLSSVRSVNAQSAVLSSFSYSYNDANQRTERREADGVYWRFGYDSLGQVTSGKKYWADGIPVAGQQFEYAFDDIGNRTETKAGGDASGSNLRTSAYYPNALNQYWSNTVPGAVEVMGVALATNTVTVNGQAPYRKGEYFRKELAVNNTAAPVWQQITVVAPNEATVTRHEFVAQTPQVFVHDDDGNLVSDGRWTYTWDGENRLVAMAARTGVGPQISLKFEYDAQGRRIRKQVWGNAAWSGSATNDLRFVYDGWNVIAVLSPQSTVLRSFTWGLDLSGTFQGAGGVGGLLMVSDSANGVHFPAFDGNGNVAALVKSDGTLSAQYEYRPFGELLRASGSLAGVNPFRFSTKYQDDETAFLYYGHRYYNASTGRWLSRDPIQEQGGLNLYAFVANDPIRFWDRFGLDPVGDWISGIYWHAWWWNIPFWSPNPALQKRDDGIMNTMGQRTSRQMDLFYFKLAREEARKGTVSTAWKTVQIAEGATGQDWWVFRKGGIDFSDAGFWLNQAHKVDVLAGGTFEMRLVCDQSGKATGLQIRNTNGKFRWFDRIDNNPSQNDGFWFWLLETGNQIPEWLTDAAFDVQVDWGDNRKDTREVE